MKNLIKIIANYLGIEIRRYFPRGCFSFLYYKMKQNQIIGKDFIGAEIGVFEGENAKDIFKFLPIKKLYLIDSYENDESYNNSKDIKSNQEILDDAKIKAKKELKRYEDKIIWIYKKSDEAFKEINEKLDFIYIDGNHTYEAVKKDIENYFPLLKKEGIMAGHDINTTKDILQAVSEFVKENNVLYEINGSDWIIWNVKTDEKIIWNRL